MTTASKYSKNVAVETDSISENNNVIADDGVKDIGARDDNSLIKKQMQRKSYSFDEKLNIIERLDFESPESICRTFNINKSSLYRWIKDLPKIKELCSHRNKTKLKKDRSAVNVELEQALYAWFCGTRADGNPISGTTIKKQAIRLSEQFNRNPTFKASDGWLSRWKKRYIVRRLTISGESLSENMNAPDAKEYSVIPKSFPRDADNRDHVCNKSDLTLIADEVFGVNKWSHSITSQTLDFVKCIEGRYFVGCSAFIRVQLADGPFHEDMGYSNSNASDEGLAIFSARAGSITNALRNTLLCFGGKIAARIKDFIILKTDQSDSLTISTIAEPKKIISIPKTKIMTPNAQSTPQKSSLDSTNAPITSAIQSNNQESLPVDKNERKAITSKYPEPIKNDGNKVKQLEIQLTNQNERMVRSPTCPKQVENGTKVNKAVLTTEEEKRLERKRRQAQLQEEFKKLHKDKGLVEKPNARF